MIAYVEYRNRSGGPGPGDLDVLRTGLFSIALFASSGTVALAGRRQRRGDARGFRLWLVATIGLGAIFLAGQITEYSRMYDEKIMVNTNLFTSAFYTLTGFHGAHVAIGLVALGVLAILAFTGKIGGADRGQTAVEAVSAYWHFVDAVWVVIFSVVYLWAVI